MAKKKKVKIDWQKKIGELILEKIKDMSFDETIQFITYTSTVFVVYNVILGTKEVLQRITADIQDSFENPLYPKWQMKINFIINPLNYIIQNLIIPKISPVEPPEPMTPEEESISDAVQIQVLGYSIIIAYLIVYKPEVLVSIYNESMDLIGNMRGFITNMIIGGS